MGQKAAGGEMGDELARRADQRLKQFASFGPGKVEGERFLRAVEIFPIKRIILSRYRPAPEIGAAANLVDADHRRTELCGIKPGGGGGDGGSRFDDREGGESSSAMGRERGGE